ncbi:Putative G-patch domain, nucleotide-binding alpha-beta plait domain superfamily [Septoria linicola]|uniref:G-patch domain, nucleotide-binding alpha-beta plait domain superfamily n=1 Tax=Septoria linicola TaxID=215465 RepID=A0A9Q9AR78_9PEZI|nr:putative G-patch domain, nucleotide-binding alpha-beta plait domain superfamily [Septoria linicola]USW50571.1 Putative G-patch domain, nucleotide-binding alpha-beta plait domain superfamily [Septoria linicola]
MPNVSLQDDRHNSRLSSSNDYYPQDYSRPPRQYFETYPAHSDDFYDEPVLPPPSNGDGDVSADNRELPFLLIRGLKANTSEEILSKGLEKLYREDDKDQQTPANNAAAPASLPTGAGPVAATPLAALIAAVPVKPLAAPGASPSSLKRVYVIRDRETEKGLTFGFAEYHTVADAKAAHWKSRWLRDKCTISSKKIEVDYPHLGVFPVAMPGQTDPKYQFQLGSGSTHQYHDQRYYASTLEVNEAPPPRTKSPSPPTATKTTKKRTKDTAGIDSLDGGTTKKIKSGEPKGMGIVNLWQKKQAELRGEVPDSHDSRPSSAGSDSPSVSVEQPQQSYVFQGEKDGKQRKACLLCGTELPEKVTPQRHCEGSEKHAANLRDEAKCQEALERLTKWGLTADQTVKLPPPKPVEKPEYRDRAKERRIQEAKAGTTEKLKVSLKGAAAAKKAGPVSTQPVAPNYGKGLNLLQKSGYKEGQGLGVGGSGLTAPIEQISYNAGVGLGHEGSKKGDANEEAARMTKGDGGFLEKTKEVARSRYERMQ